MLHANLLQWILTPGKSCNRDGWQKNQSIKSCDMKAGHQNYISPHQHPRRFGTRLFFIGVVKNILHRRGFCHGTSDLLRAIVTSPGFRFSHFLFLTRGFCKSSAQQEEERGGGGEENKRDVAQLNAPGGMQEGKVRRLAESTQYEQCAVLSPAAPRSRSGWKRGTRVAAAQPGWVWCVFAALLVHSSAELNAS